jgi:L-serine dehydratase
MFARRLEEEKLLLRTVRIKTELFGSLGATGIGHGSDKAVILGLEGEEPDAVDPDAIPATLERIHSQGIINLLDKRPIPFNRKTDILFHHRTLPYHPNGMTFHALDADDVELLAGTYYSIGGGFVVDEEAAKTGHIAEDETPLPYPFGTGGELLEICRHHNLAISQVMMANERVWRTEAEIRAELLHIWEVMEACVRRGLQGEGPLPGGLNVPRRAPVLHRKLTENPEAALRDPLSIMDWVNLYALAVNEENAAGGRVVTAPTNGAAGIIPAVLHYWTRFIAPSDADLKEGVVRFLLTAGAIGSLYQKNASISGADVGCQGEVGVACSMAAAGLAEVRGGSPGQVENAAEIGMEHNLGLTCDPIAGLVQIPCIERNAMAAGKAINAARSALRGDGAHFVSLDKVIKTMRETGADMQSKYKETSLGGLAVNVIEC